MAAIAQTPRINDIPSEPQLRLWTREEYYKMAEAGIFRPDERTELIGGRIYVKAPQTPQHAAGISLVGETLRSLFNVGSHVRMHGPLNLSSFSEPEPDVAVVRGTIRDYAKAHPNAALLVVEVAESSLAYDRGIKASLYASAGIPEYWVLNLVNRRLEVSRDPIAMPGQLHGYGYRTCTHYLAADAVTPLAAATGKVTVADLLP
jgi:Uma2 family endonuclease